MERVTPGKRRSRGKLSAEDDEFFEETAIWDLSRTPAKEWASLLILWRGLGAVDPSTAKRVIAHALRLCAERQEPPPIEFANAADELLLAASARNRPRLAQQQREAAIYVAHNPEASAREIAKRFGTSHQTVQAWRHSRRFNLFLQDEKARIDHRNSMAGK